MSETTTRTTTGAVSEPTMSASRVWREGGRLCLLAAAAFLLAGCSGDDRVMAPETTDGMFRQYVAMGASITAGFQSGGINDSTQREAYPVLLARAMGLAVQGEEFNVPSLVEPGCPPPFVDILVGQRVGGGNAGDCDNRSRPIPPVVHNVAVPGAEAADFTSNSGPGTNPNGLTQLILGGQTQVDAAARADPTFMTVFMGGGDVLDALVAGDPSVATAPADFDSRIDALVSRLQTMDLEGAALIGVPNVLDFDAQGRPTFQLLALGQAYWQASQQAGWPGTFTVDANCAPSSVTPDGQPGEFSAVPFNYGIGTLFAQALAGTSVTLDCLADAQVLTVPEQQTLAGIVQQYNTKVQSVASNQGWAFVDATPALESLRTNNQTAAFPNLDQDPSTPTFPGGWSEDGVHLGRAGHILAANEIIRAINAEYGTSVPTVPVPPGI